MTSVDPMEDCTKETAKAVQEVAKTTSEVAKLTAEFSGFLGRIFGAAMKDIGEIAHLKTQMWKLKNAIVFKDKVESLMKERGLQHFECALPRIGLPIIESAVSEDSEELQDLWSRLMLSTVTKNLVSARRSHVESIRQLEPEDARAFKGLCLIHMRSLFNEEQNRYVHPGDLTSLFRYWESLRTLQRIGIITLIPDQNDKELQWGEAHLSLVELDEQGEQKKT